MAPKSKAAKTSAASSPATAPFNAGSAVEISPDDHGFRGSLFTGKIIRRLANDRVLIEYDNLMADESGSKRLRENLKLHQLRPIPPTETCREFKFGDEVDAYHNDGWWEGHITEECGNERFAVYFRVSREQIVFHKEELRLHREWFNENWVPPFPQKQQEEKVLFTPTVMSAETVTSDVKSTETVTPNVKPVEIVIGEERFSVGTLVEVSSDKEGFQGAWFCATIVQVIGKRKFLVEYQSLLADDDSQLLREEVNTQHIRPHPPQTVVDGHFSLLEEVDVFHNYGWWVGMVSKVLDNSGYVVYFRNNSEELEFQHSQLRKHQDWIGGKWIMASKVWPHDCMVQQSSLYHTRWGRLHELSDVITLYHKSSYSTKH
ncbi:putative Agenet-like domain-containing protein [Lupinus albus]|uniref:Putative Agenet-like domain-containing protein n=1 Tax=Lupinus albus TaxID=3870 RepID=A0A6A4R0P2_LUPAL|nr:putative Agenet-like domain-containing protein [Lupinus albus]